MFFFGNVMFVEKYIEIGGNSKEDKLFSHEY